MSTSIRLADPVRSFADYLDSKAPTDYIRHMAYMVFGIVLARQEKSNLIFPNGLNQAPQLVVTFAKTQYKILIQLDAYGIYLSEAAPGLGGGFWMGIDDSCDTDYIFHRLGNL